MTERTPITTPDRARRACERMSRRRGINVGTYARHAERYRRQGLSDVAAVFAEAAVKHAALLARVAEQAEITPERRAEVRKLAARRTALCLGTRVRVGGWEGIVLRLTFEGDPVFRGPSGEVEAFPFGQVAIFDGKCWI